MCRDAVVHVRLVVPMIQLIQWQASKRASDGRRLGSARRRFSVIFGPVSCLSVCCSGGRTITSRVSTPLPCRLHVFVRSADRRLRWICNVVRR